jgi:RNA polymerase sigma factor (TIGR02999 family)
VATPSAQVTELVVLAARGEGRAIDGLAQELYGKLRGLAGKILSAEEDVDELQPTALVHETYLRLVDQNRVDWRGRTHFCAIAARVMRRVLVDHVRARRRAKRGGGRRRISLTGTEALGTGPRTDLLELHEAIEELAALDERQARLVEMRFFGGLTVREAAEALGLPLRTTQREWSMAKAWLKRELTRRRQ